jgi:hypothetical protein
VSWRRGVRAILIGVLTFMIALRFVPHCQVRFYEENAVPVSLGLAAVMTFFAYRC